MIPFVFDSNYSIVGPLINFLPSAVCPIPFAFDQFYILRSVYILIFLFFN